MKLTKKLFAVLLAALMLLTAVPFAFAAQVDYNIADGVLTVTGSGEMPSFQYTDRPWAASADSITSIVVEGCTNVSPYAFKDLAKVTEVTLSESVQDIDIYAFLGCEALTTITLPAELTALKTGVFSGCKALTAITIPDKVEEIQTYAFNQCGLTEIFLPFSVKNIAKNAFAHCEALKKVTVKNNECNIVSGAFPPPAEAQITFYSVYNSKADNFAIANGYGYERIPDENKPQYDTPDTVQEVVQVSQDNLKDTKFGSFLRRLFELLGLQKKEEPAQIEGGGSGSGSGGGDPDESKPLVITGVGADIGNFLMKTSLAEIILSLREALQTFLSSAGK